MLDDDFEPVYGVWILLAEDAQDEPVIVQVLAQSSKCSRRTVEATMSFFRL